MQTSFHNFGNGNQSTRNESVFRYNPYLSKGNQKKYRVEGTKIGYVELAGYNPVIVNRLAKFGGDQADESGTSLTGIGFGDTRNVEFVFPGQINTLIPDYDWQLNGYCDGSIKPGLNEMKNSIGSHSVETLEQRKFYWERGTNCVIPEMAITIGRLEIIVLSNPYPLPDKWIIEVVRKKTKQGDSLFASAWKSVTLCQFRGKETALWYNSAAHEIYILVADELQGVLQIGNIQDRIKRKTQVEFTLLA